jgi:hypothetical protein
VKVTTKLNIDLQLTKQNKTKQNTAHFPTLNDRAKSVSFSAAKYATEVGVLRKSSYLGSKT